MPSSAERNSDVLKVSGCITDENLQRDLLEASALAHFITTSAAPTGKQQDANRRWEKENLESLTISEIKYKPTGS